MTFSIKKRNFVRVTSFFLLRRTEFVLYGVLYLLGGKSVVYSHTTRGEAPCKRIHRRENHDF